PGGDLRLLLYADRSAAAGPWFPTGGVCRPGAGPVVVLSHAFWKGQFAGDTGVLGKSIVLNRNTFTIVGVAPEGFSGASMLGADVWAPISAQAQWIQGRDYMTSAD